MAGGWFGAKMWRAWGRGESEPIISDALGRPISGSERIKIYDVFGGNCMIVWLFLADWFFVSLVGSLIACVCVYGCFFSLLVLCV